MRKEIVAIWTNTASASARPRTAGERGAFVGRTGRRAGVPDGRVYVMGGGGVGRPEGFSLCSRRALIMHAGG